MTADERELIDHVMAPGDEARADSSSAALNDCPGCGGTGEREHRPCKQCAGTGVVREAVGGG